MKVVLVGMMGFVLTSYNVSTNGAFDGQRFNECWRSMQKSYQEVSKELDRKGLRELEKTYYHAHWANAKNAIGKMILGSPNPNFLSLPAIGGNMVVGSGPMTEYEISFIRDYPSEHVRSLIAGYREPSVGPNSKDYKELNCSANALHLLCYAAKVLELFESPAVLVEFGSGYGCLAHIFKQLVPDCTLFLIDLPELLAIQYLYLQYALPQAKIIFHSDVNEGFEQHAIHLIPVHFLSNLNIKSDVFVSTFAITESPQCVQKIVCDKRFFDAQLAYIVGQLYGWNHQFENHFLLCSTARSLYTSVLYLPYYYTLGMKLQSYECVAVNPRGN